MHAAIPVSGYEPLAMRAIHGRLQGHYFYQPNLLSWAELERHEGLANALMLYISWKE